MACLEIEGEDDSVHQTFGIPETIKSLAAIEGNGFLFIGFYIAQMFMSSSTLIADPISSSAEIEKVYLTTEN